MRLSSWTIGAGRSPRLLLLTGASQVTIPNAETSKADDRLRPRAGRRVSEGVSFLHTNNVVEETLHME